MGNPALDALGFIVGTLLNLYAMVVALRFVMQAVRADYYNPIAQFVVKATDPLLVPLRRLIPSVSGYDTASLVLVWAILFAKLLAFANLGLGPAPAIGRALPLGAAGIDVGVLTMLALSFVDLVYLMFNIFIFSLFIQALLSWLPNAGQSPVAGLLQGITRPVLTPIRRFVPPMGGLDLSSLVAIIGLFALRTFVVGVLWQLVVG